MEHKNDLDFNAKLYGKKFGFRKLSAGLAAVVLITTFFLSNSHLVNDATDEQANDEQANEENTDTNEEPTETEQIQ